MACAMTLMKLESSGPVRGMSTSASRLTVQSSAPACLRFRECAGALSIAELVPAWYRSTTAGPGGVAAARRQRAAPAGSRVRGARAVAIFSSSGRLSTARRLVEASVQVNLARRRRTAGCSPPRDRGARRPLPSMARNRRRLPRGAPRRGQVSDPDVQLADDRHVRGGGGSEFVESTTTRCRLPSSAPM